jgi:hypothetical protein
MWEIAGKKRHSCTEKFRRHNLKDYCAKYLNNNEGKINIFRYTLIKFKNSRKKFKNCIRKKKVKNILLKKG